MMKFYYHPSPNPLKVALFLEETETQYEAIPIDTFRGEQHSTEFREINPNGKVPVIVLPGDGNNPPVRVFDSTAILLFLAEKSSAFLGSDDDRGELLSWLCFVSSGLGPFSGQAVHFQFTAPAGNDYGVNRYRREAERHYEVLDQRLAEQRFLTGEQYTIADMSAWGWIAQASRVLKDTDYKTRFTHIARWFSEVDARPAAGRARSLGKDVRFKKVNDEETQRSLFPSNYVGQER